MYAAADCLTIQQLHRLSMQGLPTFICVYNNSMLPVALNPFAQAQASISSAAPTLSDHITIFPFNEPRLGLRISAGRLEKHEDVVG
jgi:hypothetical protein